MMLRTWARVVRFVFENSILLVVGTAVAVAWANLDTAGYDHATHPLHFWVNDVGMVFFFALAAKEVFEATLPGGPLASLRQAASPLAAAVGGMVAPALIFVALATRHWACVVGPWVGHPVCDGYRLLGDGRSDRSSPAGHPAIPFLLLLAIADDALGLMILAVFYPSGTLSFAALGLLMSAALLLAWWLRRRRTTSFWPYVLGPGALSWAALYWGGFHPALALVPVVPFMPHSARDLGLFDPAEEAQADTLSHFEHWWARPVQVVLLLFGLANAGVPFAQMGNGTYYVLAALLLGKPLGIVVFSYGARLAGARLPDGLRLPDLLVVGLAAAIGFTVALFFATAAFPPGPLLAETKMGALLSFGAAPLALLASRLLRGRPT